MKLKSAFISMFGVILMGFVLVTIAKMIDYEPARDKIFLIFNKISIISIYENPIYNGWITIFLVLAVIFFFYELFDAD